MRIVFLFRTSRFKSIAPKANPVNEMIGGEELASWLAASLRDAGFAAVDPWAEDHGWDFTISHENNTYLIVSSRDLDETAETGGTPEYLLQVELHRSFLDRLLGRRQSNRETDPVVAAVRSILAQQHDFEIVDEMTV
jgi:hypothetical protein